VKVAVRLVPEDHGTHAGETVPALCRALSRAAANAYDDRAAPAILQALAIIGDGRAIGAVERAARKARRGEIREAAASLLPILQQRAAESQAPSQLLRASSATVGGEKVLLRAASGSTEADGPAVLLRASKGPEGERQTRP
jgi:hypothetical protein